MVGFATVIVIGIVIGSISVSHSKEEWIKCLKAEDDAMLDKIRKHYDK